jgi:2-oxo-4-hydroxy-4-carboxy-5-ureidoimidazoline decarboxylase
MKRQDTFGNAIEQINQLPPSEFREAVYRCCASSRWANQMVKAGPYLSVEGLQDKAVEIWSSMTNEDYLEAFKGHPMIGSDLDALRRKFTHTSEWSEGEQAGMQSASESVLKRLQAANIQYLNRFGYIFIVCATGKSAAEMVGMLEVRLTNLSDVEMTIAAGEQQKITTIRLNKWFEQLV